MFALLLVQHRRAQVPCAMRGSGSSAWRTATSTQNEVGVSVCLCLHLVQQPGIVGGVNVFVVQSIGNAPASTA